MLGLDTIAQFTWDFGQCFLLEVSDKYYVWSDPDYNGDNTIKQYVGNPMDFTSPGFSGRDKGSHTIGGYCGEQVKFIGC
jgi:hypothetical protein